jgi:cysteinyl-tRNA synthetase
LADEYERDSAADFALWKARRPEDGPNFWPSPWGEGRPGWHIECSAMAMKHLGESFDLHGGGVDLVFPHHENEIAQSEAATGQRFARHWFHVAHLLVEGQKMSKSLGNLYTLEDVAARGFTAEDVRFALLAGHYRQPLNFTWDSVSAASKSLARFRRFKEKIGSPGAITTDPFLPVLEALADDLNTSDALGRVFTTIKELSAALEEGRLDEAARASASAGFARAMFAFGFLLEGPAEETIPADIAQLAEERWQARLNKDWAASDRLRDQLLAAGWTMRDGRDGYTLAPAEKP